jgi:hypothetical protein
MKPNDKLINFINQSIDDYKLTLKKTDSLIQIVEINFLLKNLQIFLEKRVMNEDFIDMKDIIDSETTLPNRLELAASFVPQILKIRSQDSGNSTPWNLERGFIAKMALGLADELINLQNG